MLHTKTMSQTETHKMCILKPIKPQEAFLSSGESTIIVYTTFVSPAEQI